MVSKAKKIQNASTCKALKKIRIFSGISRTELSERLGVTSKAIEKYENGRDILSNQKVENILKALGNPKNN